MHTQLQRRGSYRSQCTEKLLHARYLKVVRSKVEYFHVNLYLSQARAPVAIVNYVYFTYYCVFKNHFLAFI